MRCIKSVDDEYAVDMELKCILHSVDMRFVEEKCDFFGLLFSMRYTLIFIPLINPIQIISIDIVFRNSFFSLTGCAGSNPKKVSAIEIIYLF